MVFVFIVLLLFSSFSTFWSVGPDGDFSWVGTGLLIFSLCLIVFYASYLEQTSSWDSEPSDSFSPLKSVPMERITDMDNVSGSTTYLLDLGDSYLFYHKVLDQLESTKIRKAYRLEPIRISKASATVICDPSIESPYVQSYQACRKYRCPNPVLVQALLFPFCYLEDGEYLTRRDPDGEIKYEIIIPDMSVISALPAGAE